MEQLREALQTISTGAGDVGGADLYLRRALHDMHGLRELVKIGVDPTDTLHRAASVLIKRAAMRRPGCVGPEGVGLPEGFRGPVLACYIVINADSALEKLGSFPVPIQKEIVIELPSIVTDPVLRISTDTKNNIYQILSSDAFYRSLLPLLLGDWLTLSKWVKLQTESGHQCNWFKTQIPGLLTESLGVCDCPFNESVVNMLDLRSIPTVLSHSIFKTNSCVGILAEIARCFLPDMLEHSDGVLKACGETVLITMTSSRDFTDLEIISSVAESLAEVVCECFIAKNFLKTELDRITGFLMGSLVASHHDPDFSSSLLDACSTVMLDLTKMLGVETCLASVVRVSSSTPTPVDGIFLLTSTFISRRERWALPLPATMQGLLKICKEQLESPRPSSYVFHCVEMLAAVCVVQDLSFWVRILMNGEKSLPALVQVLSIAARPMRLEENPENKPIVITGLQGVLRSNYNEPALPEPFVEKIARTMYEMEISFIEVRKYPLTGLKYLSASRNVELVMQNETWIGSLVAANMENDAILDEFARVMSWVKHGDLMRLVETGFQNGNKECAGCLVALKTAIPAALSVLPVFEGDDAGLSLCIDLLPGLDYSSVVRPVFIPTLQNCFYYPRSTSSILSLPFFPNALSPLAVVCATCLHETKRPPTLLRLALGSYIGKLGGADIGEKQYREAEKEAEGEGGGEFVVKWREFQSVMEKVPLNRGRAVGLLLDV